MLHGPDEVDLVNSGLEETMINATHEIIEMLEEPILRSGICVPHHLW